MSITQQPTEARTASPHEHVPLLDSYRALAALAVLATHAAFQTGVTLTGQVGAVMARLDVGVAIFFSLSGYLLYRPWALAAETGEMAPGTKAYLWRRALRILPAYWVVVLVAVWAIPENQGVTVRELFAQLTLTQTYASGPSPTALTQMWSLCAEVAFYLLLPLLAGLGSLLARRGHDPLRFTVVIASCMLGVNVAWLLLTYSGRSYVSARLWLPSYLSWFAVGMLLAGVSARRSTNRAMPRWAMRAAALAEEPGACLVTAGAVLLISSTSIGGALAFEVQTTPAQAVTKNLLYAMVGLAVMLPGTLGGSDRPVHRFLRSRPLMRLGEVSYGIFLWHLIILYAVFHLLGQQYFRGGFVQVFGLTMLLSIGVATISWTILERPLMRRLRSLVS